MSELDLTDPFVRRMAEQNHEPAEMWTYGGKVTVTCSTCGQVWPCSTRQALDALPKRTWPDV